MLQPRNTTASTDDKTSISSKERPGHNPPLVIVSEHGRHSQASRRIVRAQAARASAAQSRETRARNRVDRSRSVPRSFDEGNNGQQQLQGQTLRIKPASRSPSCRNRAQDAEQRPSPAEAAQQHSLAPANPTAEDVPTAVATLKPLVNWVTNVLQPSAIPLAAAAVALTPGPGPVEGNTRDGPASDMEEISLPGGLFSSMQLPVTLPRGFAALQTRTSLSGPFLALLSRSACFDYDSPGVDLRLNQLLFDIVMTSATSKLLGTQPTHPIQEHLRIASACLTIWNCQRAERSYIGKESKYTSGLEAALQEAMELDQDVLQDADSAEAALWAMFIISVTCGSAARFHSQILALMNKLQLASWGAVRNLLVNFNYPVTTLDQRCKSFYERLLRDRDAQVF